MTLFGMFSNARLSTRRLRSSSASSLAACIQIFTELGSDTTPRARIALAFSGVLSLAASIHTSSDFGHASHPFWMKLLAAWSFPASSSNLAAAIHPGACFGLVEMTDFKSSLAFLMSEISASDEILMDFKSVRYPFGSTTVCPDTESDSLSSFRPSTVPRPSPTALRSVSAPSSTSWVLTPFSSSALCSSVSGAGANCAKSFFFFIV